MLQTGEVLHDRYEILNLIGKGGMSTVYLVRDLATNMTLAIKDVERTSKGNNQVFEQSLSAEGRMLMQLSNPHLPRIHEVIENETNFMLVMDYIEGESLDKLVAREGSQTMDKVLDWGIQICDVFHYLHNQPTPIIYRDMKPANVMLQPDGQLKMIDFGTARTEKVGIAMQADTVCIGTAGFAAPEQFGGIGQSTARTDIFCLGATLYNLITGHSPCDRPTGILPLGQWNPTLTDCPLEEVIRKCTRNDPNERYQSALELREDLLRVRAGTYRKKNIAANLWQKQDSSAKGLLSNGISGLLQIGKSDNAVANSEEQHTLKVQSTGWQHAVAQAEIKEQPPATQMGTDESEDGMLIQKLLMIFLLVAAIFLILTIVLALFRLIKAAIVFLLIAVASAIAAIVCLLKSPK